MVKAVHRQFIGDFRPVKVPLPEHVGGDIVEVDLVVLQNPSGLLHQHGLAAPLRLAVVQNGHRADGVAAGEHPRHPVSILHQRAEVPVLGVVAVGVEVGRAVLVREGLGGEGVGHKTVHAPYHEMIQQVFFQMHALFPAVVAENFAHGAALHVGVQRAQGRAQLAKGVVVELAVVMVAEHVFLLPVLHARLHLAADVVDAGHGLPFQAPEVVAQAGAGAGVLVVVLHHVADVLHAVIPAPPADLVGEVLLHQPGHAVHKGVADFRRQEGIAVIRP